MIKYKTKLFAFFIQPVVFANTVTELIFCILPFTQ